MRVFSLFKAMSKSPENRAKFIKSAIEFVRKYEFDGLDMDWEYPSGPTDKKNHAILVKVRCFAQENRQVVRITTSWKTADDTASLYDLSMIL